MAGYQSYYQIVQTPTSVAIMTEMIHDVRIIPLDGGPHAPAAVQQWMGDSRGHWEGDTLVVDTTNYKPRAFMSVSSEKLHVIERFSRSGPETLKYEITIDDPETWTKPWTLMIPLRHSPNRFMSMPATKATRAWSAFWREPAPRRLRSLHKNNCLWLSNALWGQGFGPAAGLPPGVRLLPQNPDTGLMNF